MDYSGLSLLVLISLASNTNSQDWGYKGASGPSNWVSSSPICGQNKQSPVNIISSAIYDANLNDFVLSGFDDSSAYTLTMVNNGHTATVNVNGGLYVQGGSLPNRFATAQFHFHWGANNDQGSEHTTDGMAYPLEMHIVNFNEQKYGNLSAAVNKPGDGLAVLGFYFTVSSSDNPKIAPLISKLSSVQNKDTMTTVTGLNIQDLLPEKLNRYYRYSGSLTTPPCYESVIWSVFDDTISISNAQLGEFRKLIESVSGGNTHYIEDNFRPLQPLNNRQITRSFPSSATRSTLTSFYYLALILLFVHYKCLV